MTMAERVIADGVPGGVNSSCEVGRALRLLPDGEERRLHTGLFERIEHTRRPLRIRPIIECEIDPIH
jgi:hypothetical protein